MLIVKNIEIVDVSEDIVGLLHDKSLPDLKASPKIPTKEEMSVPIEVVHGRRFINADGEEFCIGMSKKAETALGLPFEVIENQQNEINVQRTRIAQLRGYYADTLEKLEEFRTMSFWSRVKFLFNRQSA